MSSINCKNLPFDSMVEFYDRTRVFDRNCFISALDFLIKKFPPNKYSNVFEPGIGTGRIAIPIAERGYSVTGIDISKEMLLVLKKRLKQSGQSLPVSFQQADMTLLPFSDAAFDMAVAVHLFWFIEEWRKAVDEILRVVRRGGVMILMHTGMGTEVPLLNNRYKELCSEYGFAIKSIGVKSTSEVINYCINMGYDVEQVRDRWKWISRIKLDKALEYINLRAYSFTTFAPDNIHFAAVKKLKSDLQERFGSLDYAVEVPNQIYLVFVRK